MQVNISIGENHRFELREALLVYGDRQRSFVTRHQVALHKDGPPTLEPAQPLTTGFLESLVRSLYGGAMAEILPENVLAKGDRMIVWWTPRRRCRMFFENAEGKAQGLNGKEFPQAPLVWRVAHGDLKIRALCDNQRPNAETTLAVSVDQQRFTQLEAMVLPYRDLYLHDVPPIPAIPRQAETERS